MFKVVIAYSTPTYPGWKSRAAFMVDEDNSIDAEGAARVKFTEQSIPGSEIWDVCSERVA